MNKNTKEYVFLLGGHDLEMKEIRKLLDQHKVVYLDEKLSWKNAKWSAYSKYFEDPKYKDKIFIGIELLGKEDMPKGVEDIDHHNFNSDKKTAIEQVAERLGIELNRWQKLVAANDKAYISGMKEMCATKKEIEEIRKKDKREQGVTEEDEVKAKESVENRIKDRNIVIVKSLTNKFSPITDLMYGKTNKLIIYNNKALTYYGAITNELRDVYKNEIKSGKIYYGGRETAGYLGFAEGRWTEKEITEQKDKLKKIVKTQTPQKLYSHHIFLFPFKWKIWDTKDNDLLEKKFEVQRFAEYLKKEDKWESNSFDLKYYSHYNEYNYFYEHVRNVLYDLGGDLKTQSTENNDKLVNHLEYKILKKNKLYYNIKLKEDNFIYQLEIDSILLNIYRTGTAVLSFHLRNHLYSGEKDILKINKFGRRLFVPFFDLKPDSIYTGKNDDAKEDEPLCATKLNEIPDAIWIGKKEESSKSVKENELYEDFEQYRKKDTFKNGPFILPKFINGLFPANFYLVHEKQGQIKGKKDKKFKIYLRPVLDDRMYVVSWYGNTELVKEIAKIPQCFDFIYGKGKTADNREKLNNYSFAEEDWWYSYVFADTSPMHTDKFERKKLLKKQTYSRWIENDTLYGFCRYSFVMLTSSFSDLENYGASYLVRHLQSMYYKMAELSLLQRATVLSYSDEVTRVSDLINQRKDTEKALKGIKSLYEHYILFVNKIYFREITAQEQGIEMYDLMQQSMRIPQEVKDLDSEIDELNRFASMIYDKEEGKRAKKHTGLGTFFLPAILISGILGMNVYRGDVKIPKYFFGGDFILPFWIPMGIILLFTIAYVYWDCVKNLVKCIKKLFSKIKRLFIK